MEVDKESNQTECEYCGKSFDHKRNIPGHLKKTCFVYKLFGDLEGTWTANKIRDLIQNKSTHEVEYLRAHNKLLQEQNAELVGKIREVDEENTELKKINSELNEILKKYCHGEGPARQEFPLTPQNVLASIGGMRPKERIKKQYKSSWKEYMEWGDQNDQNVLLPVTAGKYLDHLVQKSKSKTVLKKRSQIQAVLRQVTGRGFILKKIDRSLLKSKKERKYMTEIEIQDLFIKKTIETKEEYRVALYLEVFTGLRINSIANLKRKDLIFLHLSSSYIKYDESKTNTSQSQLLVDSSTINLLRAYVRDRSDDIDRRDGFLFPAGKSDNHDIRANYLQKALNKELRRLFNLNLLKDIYTTHDLRRTHAFIKKHEIDEEEKGVERAQKALRHSNKHVTKTHYLVPETIKVDSSGMRNDILNGKEMLNIAEMTQEEADNLKRTFTEALQDRNCEFNDDLSHKFFVESSRLSPVCQENAEIFRRFKERSRGMMYAPLVLEQDATQGWIVRATRRIEARTLLCEYSGQVMKYSKAPKSDSVMEYVDYLGCSYVIVPDSVGNIARFISGVNNSRKEDASRVNVLSMKCNIDDNIHILLFACKTIEAGDVLYYDYNGGDLQEYQTDRFI
jgi:integrase